MPSMAKRVGHDCKVRYGLLSVEMKNATLKMPFESEDGKIVLRDSRVEARRPSAQMTLQNDCEFTGVRWNPRMDSLFATSDNHGRVYLRDTRTSFGSALNRTRQPLEQVRLLICNGSVPAHGC